MTNLRKWPITHRAGWQAAHGARWLTVIGRRLVAVMMIAAALFPLFFAGCAGYQLGAPSMYRSDVRTVYVPIFRSNSFRPDLGERITEAVIKEIEATTPYRVVTSLNADSTLYGTLLGESKRVVSENEDDDPRNIAVRFHVRVNWVTRQGQPIGNPTAIPLPTALTEIDSHATLAPEAGQSIATAQQQAIDRLASQIVAQMEAPW